MNPHSYEGALRAIVRRAEHCGRHAGPTATRQAMLDMLRIAEEALRLDMVKLAGELAGYDSASPATLSGNSE